MLDTDTYNYRSITLYKDYKIIYRVDYSNDYVFIVNILNMRMSYETMQEIISGK